MTDIFQNLLSKADLLIMFVGFCCLLWKAMSALQSANSENSELTKIMAKLMAGVPIPPPTFAPPKAPSFPTIVPPPAPPQAKPPALPPASPVAIHDSPQIAALKAANAKRWAAMHVKADRIAEFDKRAAVLCAPDAKARYQKISETTGVPWYVIAVIHEREAAARFNAQLAQGDPLDQVSIHEPAGRGPFLNHPDDPPGQDAFYRGALDALIDCGPHASKWHDWSIGGLLTLLEEYNGLGYANRGVPSAYVWSGSDQYVAGKYIADHEYSASAVDVQLGCAPLLARMAVIDPTIVLSPPNV